MVYFSKHSTSFSRVASLSVGHVTTTAAVRIVVNVASKVNDSKPLTLGPSIVGCAFEKEHCSCVDFIIMVGY